MLGNWTGTYKYEGKRIPHESRERETIFHIKIQEFDGTIFSGIVQDDPATGGMQGIGLIHGQMKKGQIKFVKEMPIQTVYMPDGSKIEENKPHRKIYYSGSIFGNEAQGIWKFKFGFGMVNNRLVIFPRSKGAWSMKKDMP